MNKYEWQELYAEYEPVDYSRDTHRRRKGSKGQQNGHHKAIKKELAAELMAMDDGLTNWIPTYVAPLDPRHYERQWVIDSVGPFYQDQVITDVTRLVKGGKEANVYACTAHPATGLELIAAKLYRPRMLRHVKNDALYKEGRFVRDADGKEMRGSRETRAMQKKTRFGQHLDTTSWIVHEYQIQTQLYESGADVPQPIAYGGNTILMAFVGDEMMAAPTLSDVSLLPEEAQPLFARVMRNVELMLRHHLIHGDLSAYNILYWDGRITLIDFPQVVDARVNRNAFTLLERDIRRVCDYFGRFGVQADCRQLAADLWQRYMQAELA